MPHPSRHRLIAISTIVLLAACTRPGTESTATTTPGDSVPIEAPDTSTTSATTTPTTAPPATTTPTDPPTSTEPSSSTSAPTSASSVPETTAAEATTTTSPAPPDSPGDLVLTFDSIGPWRFGERDVDVVPGLAAVLGDPVDDVLSEFPVADEGSFLDESGEVSYVAPFGRTVCFATALCAQFGAGAPETLILTGWRLTEEAPPELATEDGLTIGATWADHVDTIAFDPLDSCFSLVDADAGGVDVTLLSADEFFLTPDDGGELVPNDVDPAEVTVIELRAGRHPIFLLNDC